MEFKNQSKQVLDYLRKSPTYNCFCNIYIGKRVPRRYNSFHFLEILGTLFIYIEVSTSVLLRFSFSLNTLIIKIMRVFVRRVAPKDFFFMSFLSGTLTSYRTAGEKGTISNRLYQFYTLTSVLKLCIIYLV